MDEESQPLMTPGKQSLDSRSYYQANCQEGPQQQPVGNLLTRKLSLQKTDEVVYSPAPKSSKGMWPLDWNEKANPPTEVRNRRLIKRKAGSPQQSSGNVFIRKRIKKQAWWTYYGRDWFHSLVDAPTLRIVLILMSSYITITFLFACCYYLIHLHYDECSLGFNSLVSAFDFALETMATIGYSTQDIFFGDCILVSLVLTTQVCIHLIVDAIVIGVIYCRLARPNARASTIIFSDKAILRRIRGKVYFMFQLCELRKHQLVEAHVRVYVMKKEVDISLTNQPTSYLQACTMRLNHPNDELGGMVLLMVPQLIVHELTATSPLMPPPLWVENRTGSVHRWNPPVCETFRAQSSQSQGQSQCTGQASMDEKGRWKEEDEETYQRLVAMQQLHHPNDNNIANTNHNHNDNSTSSKKEEGGRSSKNDYYDVEQLSAIQFPHVTTRLTATNHSPTYPSTGIAHYAQHLHTTTTTATSTSPLSPAPSTVETAWQRAEREMITDYLMDRQIEIIAIVEGIDSATGGNVQARQSYVLSEIEWNQCYQYCLFQDPEDDFTTIDFELFHQLQPAPYDAAYPGPIVSSL